MRTNLPISLLFGVALIALGACGGGGSDDGQLRIDLEAAQAAQAEAEAAAEEAVAARKKAEEEAAEAERQRLAEEGAREEAEDEAEQERLAAEEAEQERLAAEAEQQRLAGEAEKAEQAANRAEARVALAGLAATDAGAGAVSAVMPKYGSTTTLTATPGGEGALSLRPSSISSLGGGWSGTALSSTEHDLVVYSNIGPATRVLLTQEYSGRFPDNAPSTANSPISTSITNDDGRLIRSGSFPTGDGGDKTFPDNFESSDASLGVDIVRISGYFQDASGYFHCTAQPCTIGRRGDRYIIVTGTWTFNTTDAALALVDDKSYMYFGWWKHEKSDGLAFATFSGGMHSATNSSDDANAFDDLGGSATYRGPAVGQYAIHQPAGSDSGADSFTARAELTANFATNMLSGTVTNFSNASDWTLTLNAASMAGGNVETSDGGTVTWEIGDATSQEKGGWIAEFFSEAPYAGQTPDGVAGTFNAQFDAVGSLTGAFGARK